jgi:ankyrin repeat protein
MKTQLALIFLCILLCTSGTGLAVMAPLPAAQKADPENQADDLDLNQELIKAARKGDIHKTKAILAKGADPNAKQRDVSLLIWVVALGHAEIVRVLVDAGAEVNSKNMPSLVIAALRGDTPIVEILLEAGANVNAKDQKNEYTALMFASVLGHTEVVKMLLAAGAIVNYSPEDAPWEGTTALQIAATFGRTEVVELLKAAGAREQDPFPVTTGDANESLILAAMKGDAAAARDLLASGADVEATDIHSATALTWAAGLGHTAVVRTLVDVGVDVNERTGNLLDWTPLMYVAIAGHAEATTVLCSAGADPNAKTHPMGPMTFMILPGVIVTAQDWGVPSGLTPLVLATLAGHRETVWRLLECGADVNAENEKGKTALMWAKELGRSEVVQMLERAGAKK